MTYGMPSLLAAPDPEELTRLCAEYGFDFVEMNMTFPWFQPGRINPARIRELKERYGVGFTLHLHDQVNPFEFSPELRKGSLEHVLTALEWAAELEIPRITMHLLPGTYSSINGTKTYLYATCTDLYLEQVLAFRTLAEERLKGGSTVFCIENTGGYQPFHRQAIGLLLESPSFGLTFDVGHSFRAGGEDEQFLLGRRDRIRHFHIHDCSIRANHLGFGEGQLDLVRYLRMAEDCGASVVAEVKEAGALLRSRDYLILHGFRQKS